MSTTWTYKVVPAVNTTEALQLHWDSWTTNMTVGGVVEQYDYDTGTYYTHDTTQTLTIPMYGANVKYDPLLERWGSSDPPRVGEIFPLFRADYPNTFVGADGCIYKSTGAAERLDVTISATGGTRILTSKEVEGFSLTLSFPNGLYHVNPSTGYETAKVSLSVFYRPYNISNPPTNTDPWKVLEQDWVASSTQRAEILKTLKHSTTGAKLPLSRYEILVVRNTEDHTGNMNYSDDAYIKSITEIVYGNIAYNHTALLGIKVRATDQISGQVPTITSLVKGIKVKVPSNLVAAYKDRYVGDNYNSSAVTAAYATQWDGTLSEEKVWTDNPVWCLYDLLTNTRYGLGNYYKVSDNKKGLMLANFYLMAKYCDAGINYVDDSEATYVDRVRPRFALNIVLDQSKSAAEWVSTIAAVMRATVFYSEGMFWLDIDRPKPVSQLFNMSNITNFTQTGTSFRGIPNSYEVQWINPAINYEIDSFKLDSKEIQEDATIEERKKVLQLIGVTNFDQAKTLTKYALLSGQVKDKLVTFKTGTDGLRCAVADVIGIQHDVPQWGYGGIITEYDVGTGMATINPPLQVVSGTQYFIKIDYGQGEMIDCEVVLDDHTTEISSLSLDTGLDKDRAVNAKFITSIVTNSIATFKVVAVKRDSDELVEITAIRHEDSLFEVTDSSTDISAYTIANYSLLQNPTRLSVQGVHASTKFYQDALGVWKTGAEVFYGVPQGSSFWSSVQIHYAKAGTAEYVHGEINSTGYFFLPYLEDGAYSIVLTSNYTTGKQTISEALKDTERHPWTTLTVSNFAPNEAFMVGVSGLSIQNMYNNGTFVGRDCIITWRKPTALDAASETAAGTETTGAATSTADNWLSHYEVAICSAQGNIRRTEKVYNERYTYTHEANIADGIARDFTVTVYAYDKLGRKSEGKSIECMNPAPAALT